MNSLTPDEAIAKFANQSLTLNEYQMFARTTASYPRDNQVDGIVYCTLELAGESGEVSNLVKKILRDDDFVLSKDREMKLKDEAGDCLWSISQLCTELGITLEGLARSNMEKLATRYKNGTIRGHNRKEGNNDK